jgi:hypothetical protein
MSYCIESITRYNVYGFDAARNIQSHPHSEPHLALSRWYNRKLIGSAGVSSEHARAILTCYSD